MTGLARLGGWLCRRDRAIVTGRAAFQGPEVDGLVYINEGNARPGIFHSVEITEAHDYDLVGKIIE